MDKKMTVEYSDCHLTTIDKIVKIYLAMLVDNYKKSLEIMCLFERVSFFPCADLCHFIIST